MKGEKNVFTEQQLNDARGILRAWHCELPDKEFNYWTYMLADDIRERFHSWKTYRLAGALALSAVCAAAAMKGQVSLVVPLVSGHAYLTRWSWR